MLKDMKKHKEAREMMMRLYNYQLSLLQSIPTSCVSDTENKKSSVDDDDSISSDSDSISSDCNNVSHVKK